MARYIIFGILGLYRRTCNRGIALLPVVPTGCPIPDVHTEISAHILTDVGDLPVTYICLRELRELGQQPLLI